MAKQKSTAVPGNPLIDENPADSLNHCAAVLDYLGESEEDYEPSENYLFGRQLILRTVVEALRYESARVTDKHRERAHG
jgi:hypothetical protein